MEPIMERLKDFFGDRHFHLCPKDGNWKKHPDAKADEIATWAWSNLPNHPKVGVWWGFNPAYVNEAGDKLKGLLQELPKAGIGLRLNYRKANITNPRQPQEFGPCGFIIPGNRGDQWTSRFLDLVNEDTMQKGLWCSVAQAIAAGAIKQEQVDKMMASYRDSVQTTHAMNAFRPENTVLCLLPPTLSEGRMDSPLWMLPNRQSDGPVSEDNTY